MKNLPLLVSLVLVATSCSGMESNQSGLKRNNSKHRIIFSLDDSVSQHKKDRAKWSYEKLDHSFEHNSTSFEAIGIQVEVEFLEWLMEDDLAEYTKKQVQNYYGLFYLKKLREYDNAQDDHAKAALLSQIAYIQRKYKCY